jgi:hypothetical protein
VDSKKDVEPLAKVGPLSILSLQASAGTMIAAEDDDGRA